VRSERRMVLGRGVKRSLKEENTKEGTEHSYDAGTSKKGVVTDGLEC